MKDATDSASAIETNAGWSGPGKNYFRGYSVPDDLTGRDGFWTLVSLATGYRRLEREEAAFLDELTTAMNASDPRIPPLKFTWVMGSLGGSLNTLGALLVWLDGSQLGPSPAADAARAWLALEALEGSAAIAAWFDGCKARGERVQGFGVPGRDQDERIEAAKRLLVSHHRTNGRYVQLFAKVEEILRTRGRLRPNIVGLVTACALDLGFEPHQMPFVVWPGLEVSAIANAVEAVTQRPEVLRRFPSQWVRYDGPPPRSTPRARGE